jgi:hypothetical protein
MCIKLSLFSNSYLYNMLLQNIIFFSFTRIILFYIATNYVLNIIIKFNKLISSYNIVYTIIFDYFSKYIYIYI